MGKQDHMSWRQRLAMRLDRPLSTRRAHQPKIYAGVQAASMLGAYGWTGFAIASTMGWWGVPIYAAATALTAYAKRRIYQKELQQTQSCKHSAHLTPGQLSTLVPQLSEDTARIFTQDAGLKACTVGFSRLAGYCWIGTTDRKNLTIGISGEDVIRHHAVRVDQHGQRAGTQAFIMEQINIFAHERAHISKPRWVELGDNHFASALTCLLMVPGAALLSYAGGMAMPALSAFGAALAGCGAVVLSQRLACRAEEYRADRGAVEHTGSGLLGNVFNGRTPTLRHSLSNLFRSNPTFAQRREAIQAHALQLTPPERAIGAARVARIYDTAAARHPHLFRDKAAEATPPHVLKPDRTPAPV